MLKSRSHSDIVQPIFVSSPSFRNVADECACLNVLETLGTLKRTDR